MPGGVESGGTSVSFARNVPIPFHTGLTQQGPFVGFAVMGKSDVFVRPARNTFESPSVNTAVPELAGSPDPSIDVEPPSRVEYTKLAPSGENAVTNASLVPLKVCRDRS